MDQTKESTNLVIKTKLKLNKNDILNKTFLPSYKGYDPEDVDNFLDKVYEDYVKNEEIILKLKEKIGDLEEENIKLKDTIKSIKNNPTLSKEVKDKNISLTSLDIDYSKNSSLDNLELLRKCDIYEKKLYKLGIDPTKLK